MLLIIISFLCFSAVCYQGWLGQLGGLEILLLGISTVCFWKGRKNSAYKKQITLVAKLLFTVAGIMILLRHPIDTGFVEAGDGQSQVTVEWRGQEDQSIDLMFKPTSSEQGIQKTINAKVVPGTNQIQVDLSSGTYLMESSASDLQPKMKLPIYNAIEAYITTVDGTTFILFALIAMGIKFVGVLSSAFAWHLLLKGQGIVFPFWQTIVTSFLIGRFIGTFLPSTIGLDGYTLYEAGKYSNQWPRVITAKGLEKFIGITGLFLGMLFTLPFGYSVLIDVTTKSGKPDAAPILAAVIAGIAGSVSLAVIIGLIKPALLSWGVSLFGTFLPQKVQNQVSLFTSAVAAYRGKLKLLFLALFSKFITHFTTAVVYYFTALAIGVTTAAFWPIVFGSNIQILGTIFSPTIAGEGAREALQALLLEKQLGGVAQAVLSGALGFIAAEAATLWGGAFLWTRKPSWRPHFALVDDKQVDYDWISEDDTGFSAEKLAQIKSEQGLAQKEQEHIN
ncbi:MAG: hypothetical protein CMK59_13565 [Proteobacteria bacterium]|nr:hypothetical protein [Pseudomonadota bacterium]